MYNFWDNLKKECESQDILLKELADKSEVAYGTIRNSISRNVTPSIEIGYKLASVLGVSIEYLLTGETPENKRIKELEDKLKSIEEILKK